MSGERAGSSRRRKAANRFQPAAFLRLEDQAPGRSIKRVLTTVLSRSTRAGGAHEAAGADCWAGVRVGRQYRGRSARK